MPITEFLLDNLSKTTAAYMELQEKETRLGSDLALAQAQLFPLRKDNARLTRENHQLHVDNIRKNDEATAAFTDQNKTIRKLQDEVANLTLAQKMKHEECDRMEAEKERLRELYFEYVESSIVKSFIFWFVFSFWCNTNFRIWLMSAMQGITEVII